jgi:phospholipid/cholesterol/gamma-HCH transport system ATP-binding protein
MLEDLTLDVPKGRITAILGPSGTGKMFLLKNILGLLVPDRGEIWVDGDQIVGLREKRLYGVRKKFKFASKPDMLATDNPIIQQFLAGRPEGPIGMDEMADK